MVNELKLLPEEIERGVGGLPWSRKEAEVVTEFFFSCGEGL